MIRLPDLILALNVYGVNNTDISVAYTKAYSFSQQFAIKHLLLCRIVPSVLCSAIFLLRVAQNTSLVHEIHLTGILPHDKPQASPDKYHWENSNPSMTVFVLVILI